MKHNQAKPLWVLGVTLLFFSCTRNVEDYYNPDGIMDHVLRGPIVKMGDGGVRSFFTIGPTGVPLKLGFEVDDAALNNLPTDPMDYAHSMFLLSIPQKAKDMTAFDHLVVSWNVHGHEPDHVYDLPHFDFHFYKMNVAMQTGIPPYTQYTASHFDNLPPAGYMPESYFATPGGVPQMGKHWVDLSSPEFNGSAFTKSFIFGSYDGATTFYEPMITRALLQSGAASSTAIPQPKYFAPDDNYYPTKYEISWDAKKKIHTVALTGFVWQHMPY